jgi:hypothetical protein
MEVLQRLAKSKKYISLEELEKSTDETTRRKQKIRSLQLGYFR